MVLCALQEAPPIMQSSAAVAVRALVMLACVVGIPILAMSGTSWSEIVKKFQDFRWPTILSPASASSPATTDEDPTSPPPTDAGVPPVFCDAPSNRQPDSANAAHIPPSGGIASPVASNQPAASPGLPMTGDIEQRLRHLGATYYLLETWGNEQQLYRFYCQVAATGDANFTHYFEAVDADPLQAMLVVLHRVESWRQQ
jgi:hypothetical protein